MHNLITNNIDIWTAALENKSAAGRGTNNKQTAYGIKKLRELILELAVRGKLVPQDPNDEPASVLLEKIAEEKARLVKEGKIKKQKLPPNLEEEDKPCRLPVSWEWERLGNLCIQITDGVHHTPSYLEEGVPFISVKDIDGQEISFNDCKYISEKQHVEINARCNPELGDLLICRIGTLGRATIVDTKRPFSLFVSVGLLKFLQHFFTPKFTHLILHSPLLLNQYEEIKAGGSHTNKLNLGDLPRLVIPVAPLMEQHRIVVKVDELMALCDQLEQQQTDSIAAHQTLVETLLKTLTDSENAEQLAQNWAILSEHFDTLFTTEHSIAQLKQSILQLAVMGKLVPQDPNDEPASVLLEKIAEEKLRLVKEGKVKKQKALPEVGDDEKPYDVPTGWELVRFGNITFNRDAERIPLSASERTTRSGQYDYYGASGIIDSIDDYLFDKPLLLIGEDGANLINRSSPIAFMARGKYWVNNHAHVIDGLNEHLLLYICLHINAISLEPYVTGTAQPKMNQAKMNMIVLGLPPLAEQSRIVAKVDELMAQCDQLQAQINKAQTTQIHLADAIVEQAIA